MSKTQINLLRTAQKPALVLAAALCCVIFTQSVIAATLTIVLTDIAEAKGIVSVAVFEGEAGFKEETPPVFDLALPAVAGEMTFVANDIPDGEYSIKAMHDANDNGKLDANFIGMPTEPWAMSNNARGNFGPPRWDDARFQIEGDTTQTLKMSK